MVKKNDYSNIQDKRLEAVLPGHNTKVTRILITSDCKYIVSIDDSKQIRIWNSRNRRQEMLLTDKKSASEWIFKYKEIESFFIN